MSTKKPSKPWRVKARAGDLDTKDFRGRKAAYDYAHTLLDQGWRVRIWRWEDGFWGEYVTLDPEEIAELAADRVNSGLERLIERLGPPPAGAVRDSGDGDD